MSQADTPAYPPFGTQVIGQAEKTLNAILGRQLAGTGLTEPGWVTLTLTAASGGTLDRDQLTRRIAGALKLGDAQARAHIAGLADAGLLDGGDGPASPVRLTEAGQRLHGRIRAAIAEITGRLWGDLPPDDLATAGRVLTIVTERANAELARSVTLSGTTPPGCLRPTPPPPARPASG